MLPEDLRIRPARLSNFALAIEVKSHPSERIRFEGNRVLVQHYDPIARKDDWRGATDQNLKQVNALRKYVLKHQQESPYFIPAVWLRNLACSDLPILDHNFLAGVPSATDLLSLLVRYRANEMRADLPRPWQNSFLRCTRDDNARDLCGAIDIFTKGLIPSQLDRSKIERITKQAITDEGPKYLDKLGQQLLVFSGRGGSGKTVRLLQVAYRLKWDVGARVLILTYNRALATDLRRLLHLMGLRDGLDEATIRMQTSEQYFWELLQAWGMAPTPAAGAPFPHDDYVTGKRDLAELLRGITPDALRQESAWKGNPSLFHWDIVMVDEAQDCPDEERDLLAAIFTPERLVIADGVDQLVRRDGRCDWNRLAEAGRRQIVPLRKALRLKSNLCRFVEAFVTKAGLDWDLKLNEDVAGGKVILIDGSYDTSMHDEIMSLHRIAGNKPIDALFCVTSGGAAHHADIGRRLEGWGHAVWDGTSDASKDSIPESLEQFRIVNYKSCRGLEGWTVVCLDFDRFLEQQAIEASRLTGTTYETREEFAARYASRWGMIPMTRAIDTLVLQVNGKSFWGGQLLELASSRSDYVEVRHPDGAPQA
jgi:hypothetical protein